MHTVYHQRRLVTTTKMKIIDDVVLPRFEIPKKEVASSMWFLFELKNELAWQCWKMNGLNMLMYCFVAKTVAF